MYTSDRFLFGSKMTIFANFKLD